MSFGKAPFYHAGSPGKITRDPLTGKALVDRQCPDPNPCNILCSITGTSLPAGCLTGGQIPANPVAFSAKWVAGSTFDISFCLKKYASVPRGPPPPPIIQIPANTRECCVWLADLSGMASSTFALNSYGPASPIPPTFPNFIANPACGDFPAGPGGGYPSTWPNRRVFTTWLAYLWRIGGPPEDSWSFAITQWWRCSLFDNQLTDQWILSAAFSGTVSSANCMDAFAISNAASGLINGGTASFTPAGC